MMQHIQIWIQIQIKICIHNLWDKLLSKFHIHKLNAKTNDALGFTYNYKFYDIIKAKAMVDLIKQAQKDYDNQLIDQVEDYYEYQADIKRGK